MALDLTDKTANGNTLTVSTNVSEETSTLPTLSGTTTAANLANSAVLSAPDSASLSITGDITIEGWVYLNNTNGDRTIGRKFGGAGNRGFQLYIDSGETFTWQQTSDGTNITTKTQASGIAITTWAHVAAVYTASAGSIAFFVNGSQVGSTQTGLPNSIFDSTDVVAAATDGTSSFILDDWRVWNTARSQAQIDANKAIRLTGVEAGLAAYWPFESLSAFVPKVMIFS